MWNHSGRMGKTLYANYSFRIALGEWEEYHQQFARSAFLDLGGKVLLIDKKIENRYELELKT